MPAAAAVVVVGPSMYVPFASASVVAVVVVVVVVVVGLMCFIEFVFLCMGKQYIHLTFDNICNRNDVARRRRRVRGRARRRFHASTAGMDARVVFASRER